SLLCQAFDHEALTALELIGIDHAIAVGIEATQHLNPVRHALATVELIAVKLAPIELAPAAKLAAAELPAVHSAEALASAHAPSKTFAPAPASAEPFAATAAVFFSGALKASFAAAEFAAVLGQQG